MQACYYDFNATNGNLNWREDRRAGYNLKETFGYDGLYRLTSWSVAKNGINTFANSLDYKTDVSGNIASKTDIGTYGYNITGKPHQISSLELTQTSYTPTSPQSITYTTFGKVNVLTDQNYKVLFTYDADQQRCKSVMQTTAGATLYTMYYGGATEKKVPVSGSSTQYTYITAGDGIAAVFIKTGTSPGALYYIHKDHLGSITALTNSSTTIVEQYAYDPWGRRRNPADWSFNNVPEPSLIVRGFTGHEHIDEMTLINMNGRIYDPVLGMFISCDNFVQSPTQSQNFNRYSYCMGNPLKFTDPSGELLWYVPIIIGAVIGGASGYMIGRANGATGWDMVGYIGGGALLGGLSGGAAVGVSAAGGGAMLAGSAAGAVGGAGFTGLATGWDGQAMLKGAAYGAIAGFVGGGVGAAIGGGGGAFAGGAVGSGLNTALYGGSGEDILKSAIIGGALSYGTYELTSYIGWKGGDTKLGNHDISYKQYKTMQADFQRSRFWGKEYGGFLMNDGSVERFPRDWRHSHGIQPPNGGGIKAPTDAFAMYHTHWDAPGKTIWVDTMGERVDNSADPLVLLKTSNRQTTTARGHGAYDKVPIDSYVINRYDVTYNVGGTRGLITYNVPFLRFFPWFNF